jgi:putative hydrolase of the HAD superfamily
MPKDVSKVKAILFDLDNTLIDFMKMKQHTINSAVEAMIDSGLPIKKEEALKIIDEIYKKHGMEYQKVFDDLLIKVLGKVDPKILAAGVVAYRKVKEGYIEPYPNVTSTLIELIKRGFNIGIISDAPAFQAWSRLVGMNLHHLFNLVVTFEDTKKVKFEELPFKLAIEKLKLKPEEIMMVGDDPRKDIAGANRAGMVSVFAKYGKIFEPDKSKPEQKADFEINDIKEILDLLPRKVK